MAFLIGVAGCWLALALGLILRKRPPGVRETKRGRSWGAGLLLQALSIGIVLGLRRPAAAGLVVGAGAILRALGRQFAYQARLVEGHRLITAGPYRFVRHPIYTGLYGLALATALVWSQWIVIPLFTAAYAVGTAIRVRSEERLLREEFGAEFDAYAARVPAVIPGLRF